MKALTVVAAGALVFPPALNVVLHFTDPLTADSDTKLLAQAVAHPALPLLASNAWAALAAAMLPCAVAIGNLSRAVSSERVVAGAPVGVR